MPPKPNKEKKNADGGNMINPHNKEMANIIYDTLFQNKQHKQLDIDMVCDQYIGGLTAEIVFTSKNREYTIAITSKPISSKNQYAQDRVWDPY